MWVLKIIKIIWVTSKRMNKMIFKTLRIINTIKESSLEFAIGSRSINAKDWKQGAQCTLISGNKQYCQENELIKTNVSTWISPFQEICSMGQNNYNNNLHNVPNWWNSGRFSHCNLCGCSLFIFADNFQELPKIILKWPCDLGCRF